jgi:hypothetical protein
MIQSIDEWLGEYGPLVKILDSNLTNPELPTFNSEVTKLRRLGITISTYYEQNIQELLAQIDLTSLRQQAPKFELFKSSEQSLAYLSNPTHNAPSILMRLYSTVIDRVPLKEVFCLERVSNIGLFLNVKLQRMAAQIHCLIDGESAVGGEQPQSEPLFAGLNAERIA